MDDGQRSNDPAAGNSFWRVAVHPFFAFVAAGCLLALVGWTGNLNGWEHWCTLLVGLASSAERIQSNFGRKSRCAGRPGSMFQLILAGAVIGISVALLFINPAAGFFAVVGHAFVLLAVIVSGVTSLIYHQTRFTARAFHPGLVLISSFLFIILAGTLLLKMPRCSASGVSCSWLDALFTSTSAVCVTGLAVENTATFFSLTGQSVILLLIQIGGLGIMTLTFFVAVVLFEGISLHDRLLLGRMIQENRLARVSRTLSFIVGLTLVCEAAGAGILYASLDAFEPRARLFHAVFHSISAFCNAGFSSLPDGLATLTIYENAVWQVTIMLLIIIGGLGALVAEDLCLWAMAKLRRLVVRESPRPRLRVHTRLVLVVTLGLILGGALVMYLTEFVIGDGPENGGTLLTAFFHSVTARTAGFNTVSMARIGPITAQALMILMLIGGSPGGTAGGMRTTVVAVGLAHLWSQLRLGRRGVVAFRRTIPAETGSQALGLMVLTGIWLMGNFIVLQMCESSSKIRESHLLFELISAFATVGLSLDLTPLLSDGSKLLLILNMFVGRIGLLTVMATLIPPDPRPKSGRPSENILLT